MIAEAFHSPLIPEHVAQGEGQVAVPGGIEAGHRLAPPGVRVQPLHQGILAVGGGVGEGIVIVIENNSLLGQLIKIRGQILVDGGGRKALRAHDDQVIVLQHSGVFILVRAGNFRAVVVDGQQLFVLGHGVQRVKVNVHDVVLDLRRCLLPLRFLRRLGLFRDIIGLLLHFGVAGQLQPEGGQQAEPLGGLVGGDLSAAVVVLVGEHLRAALPDAEPGQSHNADGQHQQDDPTPCLHLPVQPFPSGDPEDERHEQGKQPREMIPHGSQHFPPEVGHRLSALGHHGQGVEGAEDEIVHHLAAVEQGQSHRQENFRPETAFFQEGQHQAQKQSRRQGKAQGVNPHPKAVKHRSAQQALPVQQGKRPIARRSPRRPNFLPVAAIQWPHLQKLFLSGVL